MTGESVCNPNRGVKFTMNRAMTSLISMGLGAAAYGMMQKTNVMSGRNMKKMRKRITKAIF